MHAKIDLLGPVQVRVADRICIPSGVRLQCALALLAIRPREVIQRDELIEELGLNETTKDTINALHAHVRRLRQWLDTEGATSNILQTAGRSGYFLDIHRRDVDAHLFIDAVNEAVTLQNKVPSIAVAMLENALAQWRGAPLTAMSESVRAQGFLRELNSHKELAQEVLLDCYLALQRYQKAAVVAHQFTLEMPYNEKIWESHIVALRMLGRHAEAAHVFRQVQKLLYDELRVAPSKSLRSALTDTRWATA
ncbi:transcriptional regulator redD [Mycobacteroides abscessus subsp. bolletii]|uniref:Regulatory domain protein n=2 Tax=Mycobacteroides abscessus subsp. bolletii TaxID=319705 RepID=A0A9Q7SI56_9MYCO|nr:BTAD domain-containing putative transcriptional regulator [Mycobacteroides abscessus]EUA69643.1 transcriptional regulatory family protein [Mycobacteroides abscessus subsp. bolletii 1513]AMU21183.1 regulator [Mycobacteroides abscessus]EIU14670.1 putative regulatory domain protein [Mycobacteroides abscessus 5S-0304]EIU15808.1 putative regulatory domain protein [Mycobacteroides abscessus 5S-0421]EIU16001.1 putative regulatory domain protein [Mycobacteroides abscessus 5S-0422]